MTYEGGRPFANGAVPRSPMYMVLEKESETIMMF
jgi:hypothetical protein